MVCHTPLLFTSITILLCSLKMATPQLETTSVQAQNEASRSVAEPLMVLDLRSCRNVKCGLFKEKKKKGKKSCCLKATASHWDQKSVIGGQHYYSSSASRGHYKLNVFADKGWEHLGSARKTVLKLPKLRGFLCSQHRLCRSRTKLLGSNTKRSLIHWITADSFGKKRCYQTFSNIPETSHDVRCCEQLLAHCCSILMTLPASFLWVLWSPVVVKPEDHWSLA